MYCCSNCFSDTFLQNHIHAISNNKGKCSFCKTENATLIEPENLLDRFEPLLALYERDRNGFAINELIQDDWNVFSFTSKRFQKKLLKAISCDNELFNIKHKPVYSREEENIELWEKLREEIKHINRFFPKNALADSHIKPFVKYIGKTIKKGEQKFFRARVNNSKKPYKISKMGKPPKDMVLNGRANPIGIPYLYVASTIDTAIAEIRGHIGEELTIAEFQIKSNLILADLRDPKNTISPFELNAENELELIYKNMPFLTLLGNELSKPIIPRVANLEYLSSQYLCELLKHLGFNGIIYKSSISDGNNYVIFNERKLKALNIFLYRITDVTTKSKKI